MRAEPSDDCRAEAGQAPEQTPGQRFRRLPDRIDPKDYVESVAADQLPSTPEGVDPDTRWMLRYSG